MTAEIILRKIEHTDSPVMAAAFAAHGWHKPESQYERYIAEQEAGSRQVIVATQDAVFAGYGTIVWQSNYAPFREAGIPEIVDLNVLPCFRRRRIATAIMDEAESRVARRSTIIGIGVGLYDDYGPAQRMYVLRGYVPDGKSTTFRDISVFGGQTVVVGDDFILWLTKNLR